MLLIAFVGGMLTILSPCILPVVPFLFAGANRTRSSIIVTLVGMSLTFALVSSLAVVSSEWVIQASNSGRHVALVVMVVFALSLIFSRLGDWLTRPFVHLGNLLDPIGRGLSGLPGSLMIGVATGLLWGPCAGPILGLILTGAILQGANVNTSLLLMAYGLGSAVSLGVFIFASRSLVNRFKPSVSVMGWIRRAGGIAVLFGAGVIATGVDSVLLAGVSSARGDKLEEGIFKLLPQWTGNLSGAASDPTDENDAYPMPSLAGAVEWINSSELSSNRLRGKVVLVEFWTFDCINCRRSLPFVKQWAKKYEKEGLVVIGVHTPEYGFERIIDNVKSKVKEYGITYPVAVDNDGLIWRSFQNHYWPAHYFIDAKGQVRLFHFGEGSYQEQEDMIKQLLAEAKGDVATGM